MIGVTKITPARSAAESRHGPLPSYTKASTMIVTTPDNHPFGSSGPNALSEKCKYTEWAVWRVAPMRATGTRDGEAMGSRQVQALNWGGSLGVRPAEGQVT